MVGLLTPQDVPACKFRLSVYAKREKRYAEHEAKRRAGLDSKEFEGLLKRYGKSLAILGVEEPVICHVL